MVTHNIPTNDLALHPVDQKKTAAYAKALDTWASLHLLDSGQILPLGDRMEFTLGRVSDAQPIMPDIDLTPYQAYASGVSRLHAVLKREGKRVFVMDLGSSNGTYLNGVRLKPTVDQTINHGDMLALGKLKIQVLLQSPV
jgi:predicted component of type VI protein secretion system